MQDKTGQSEHGCNINVRMDSIFASELTKAAHAEQRSRSELIRHILRLEMAHRGLLNFRAQPTRLKTARQIAAGQLADEDSNAS